MTSYTDVFGTGTQSPANPSLASYTLTANLQLNWPQSFTDSPNVTANIIDVTPNPGPFNIILPNATEVSVGQTIFFYNIGANAFRVAQNGNINPVTINAGQSLLFYLRDNTTAAGTWGTAISPGTPAITSITLASSSNNVTVNGGVSATITTSGTFTLALANDLSQLSGFGGSVGIAARTAANTWALRTLTQTANQILITNPQGIAGNPTFSLSPTITGITDITMGNIRVTGNTISSVNANGFILFSPNGTGEVAVNRPLTLLPSGGSPVALSFFNNTGNGYVGFRGGNCAPATALSWVLPLVDGTAGQTMTHTGAAQTLQWSTVPVVTGATTLIHIPRFSNITGGIKDSLASIDDNGVLISNFLSATGNGASPGSLQLFGTGLTSVILRANVPALTYDYTFPNDAPNRPNETIVNETPGPASYVFRQAVITRFFELTTADVLAMSANPYQLVAGVPNFVIHVHKFVVEYFFNTVAFANGGNISLEYGNAALAAGPIAAGPIATALLTGGVSAISSIAGTALAAVQTNTIEGQSIYISNATAPFITGNGSIRVSVSYSLD